MNGLPIIALLTVQVGIGLYMGMNYLRGTRNKPTFIGIHFLAGAVALEVMALVLRGAPNGDQAEGRSLLTAAAALVAAALLTGLAGAMLYKPMPKAARVALYSHAGIGLAAFAAIMLWIAT